jgi:hypothetical protein
MTRYLSAVGANTTLIRSLLSLTSADLPHKGIVMAIALLIPFPQGVESPWDRSR